MKRSARSHSNPRTPRGAPSSRSVDTRELSGGEETDRLLGGESGEDAPDNKANVKTLLRATRPGDRPLLRAAHKKLSTSSVPHIYPKGKYFDRKGTDGEESTRRPSRASGDEGEGTWKDKDSCYEHKEDEYYIEYEEHMMTLENLAEAYETEIDFNNPKNSGGIKPNRAEELYQKYGPNMVTPPPRTPGWLLFLLQFTNLFMVLLITAALLSIVIYVLYGEPSDLYLGVILLIVVIATCWETYHQEAKSDEFVASLKTLMPEKTIVTRGGEQLTVNVEQLVVGDVVKLKFGDKVPADCRIIYHQSLKVDQSNITGESESTVVECCVEGAHTDPLKARNIIFSGSLVVDGSAQAVVIRTGDNTLIGGVVGLTSEVTKGESNLKKDIEYFVFIILIFALVQAVGVLIASIMMGDSFANAFVNGFIVIIIANVPQGLPSTIVACLVIVAERMAESKIFVKKLDVIEALGACTMVCCDKTGILTINQMGVENLWVMDEAYSASEFTDQHEGLGGHSTHGHGHSTHSGHGHTLHRGSKGEQPPELTIQVRTLIEIAALNSRVVLDEKEAGGELVPHGDATELGLYRFLGEMIAERTGMEIEEYRKENPKLFDIPYSNANKWQMSLHKMADIEANVARGQQVMIVKGVADVVINKCSHYLAEDGTTKPIDQAFITKYAYACDLYRGQGEMIQSYAMKILTKTLEQEEASDKKYRDKLKVRLSGKSSQKDEEPARDFVFVGVITLLDPPREEVGESIEALHIAGVKVVMVTGDHPLTAEAIGRKIGLITLPSIIIQDDENILSKIGTMEQMIMRERGRLNMDNFDEEEATTKEKEKDMMGTGSDVASDKLSERAEKNYAVIVLGTRIDTLTVEEWAAIISMKEIVFARTSPEQKLTIVEEFTKAGHVIAMTGDGVHDLPALRQASIAIAMGESGSDVAREAADIILLDDNFASIVMSVKEGRLLFANLKKSIAYTLAHSMPEVLPILLYTVVGWPQPINSILLLLIDLLTELVPAISLAYEKAEANIMLVPPRNVATDKLVSFPLLSYAYLQAGLIITGCCLYVYFQSFAYYGITAADINNNKNTYFIEKGTAPDFTTSTGEVYDNEEQDFILGVVQAGYYLMIVCGQAVHVFVCRTAIISVFEHGIFTNMTTNLGVCIAILLGCMVVYIPVLQKIDGAEDAIPETLAVGTTMAFVLLWGWTEGRKWFSRNYPRHWLNGYLQW